VSPSELRNIATGLSLDANNEPIHADKITIKKQQPKQKKKKDRKKKEKKKEEVHRKRKNADKLAMLKELVKKKAEAKKTKRCVYFTSQIMCTENAYD